MRDDRHAIAHRLGHFERVCAHHDRVAAPRVLAEQILEDPRRLRVESDHRLVDDDHLRPMHERTRDDQLLAHAVAVALHQLVAPILEIEQRQQLPRAMLHLGAFLIVQAGHEAQELRAGQLLIDEWAVGNESEPLLRTDRIGEKIHAGDGDLSVRRTQDAGDHAQRRGLAGTIGSEKAEQLAAGHFEVDRVHRGEAAVALGEPAKADHYRVRKTDLWAEERSGRTTPIGRRSGVRRPIPTARCTARGDANCWPGRRS